MQPWYGHANTLNSCNTTCLNASSSTFTCAQGNSTFEIQCRPAFQHICRAQQTSTHTCHRNDVSTASELAGRMVDAPCLYGWYGSSSSNPYTTIVCAVTSLVTCTVDRQSLPYVPVVQSCCFKVTPMRTFNLQEAAVAHTQALLTLSRVILLQKQSMHHPD